MCSCCMPVFSLSPTLTTKRHACSNNVSSCLSSRQVAWLFTLLSAAPGFALLSLQHSMKRMYAYALTCAVLCCVVQHNLYATCCCHCPIICKHMTGSYLFLPCALLSLLFQSKLQLSTHVYSHIICKRLHVHCFLPVICNPPPFLCR